MTANLNTRGGPLSRLCRALLGLFGWRVVLVPPPVPRAVVIFYPHTTNRDFVIGIMAWLALTGDEAEDLAAARPLCRQARPEAG